MPDARSQIAGVVKEIPMADAMKRPIVFDQENKQFSELPAGQFVAADALPVGGVSDSGAPNILQVTDDGLAVYAHDIVSAADDNALTERDGKLYVPNKKTAAASLVSKDADNQLRTGSDDALFVPPTTVVSKDEDNLVIKGSDGGALLTPNDVLSNGHLNLLTIDSVDHKIILTKEDIQDNIDVISADEGNLIHPGSDKGVYLSMKDIMDKIDFSKLLSSDSDNVLRLGADGKLKVVVVSADRDNLLVAGTDKGAYTPLDRGDMPR